MKRLAQQEYNNMLEELQEDDNVDDDGEIFKKAVVYILIQLVSCLSRRFLYFPNNYYIDTNSHVSMSGIGVINCLLFKTEWNLM